MLVTNKKGEGKMPTDNLFYATHSFLEDKGAVGFLSATHQKTTSIFHMNEHESVLQQGGPRII